MKPRVRWLLLAWLALASCTAATTVAVRVDLLSYIPVAGRSASTAVLTAMPLAIYLLPGVQIDAEDAGPNETMRRGSLVETRELSVPASTDLRAIVSARIRITNDSATESVPALAMRIVVAPADATNVYAEGTVVGSISLAGIAPNSDETLVVTAEINEGTPGFDALAVGAFRVGVSVNVASSVAPTSVPISLTVAELTATLGFRPFGLLEGL